MLAPVDSHQPEDNFIPEAKKVAIVVRADTATDLSMLVDISSRTLLGQFKKLYKRRDPSLKEWESEGQPIIVHQAANEDVLIAVQAAARERIIPTHTFVTRRERGKDRRALVVGPAPSEELLSVVGNLVVLQ